MKKSGFTLVEIIVVVAIMAVLGLIFTNTLTQTLRGQNKVRVLNQVKQNGQVVLDKLTSEIRRAEKIVCVGKNQNNPKVSAGNDTIVILRSGVYSSLKSYSRFRFFPPSWCGGGSLNGCIQQNTFSESDFTGFGEAELCSNPLDFGMGQSGAFYIITESGATNGISIDYDGNNPIFSRSQAPGYADAVTIQFRAFQGVGSGGTYESEVAEGGILFKTVVQVRGGS